MGKRPLLAQVFRAPQGDGGIVEGRLRAFQRSPGLRHVLGAVAVEHLGIGRLLHGQFRLRPAQGVFERLEIKLRQLFPGLHRVAFFLVQFRDPPPDPESDVNLPDVNVAVQRQHVRRRALVAVKPPRTPRKAGEDDEDQDDTLPHGRLRHEKTEKKDACHERGPLRKSPHWT